MAEPEYDPLYLDREMIVSLAEHLGKSDLKVDRGMSQYLHQFLAQSDIRSPILSLGMAAMDAGLVRSVSMDSAIENRSASGSSAPKIGPLSWGLNFIKKILSDLRNSICGSNKKPKPLDKKSEASLVLITTAIMHKFHVSSPTATGLAVISVIAISRSTKKAFCEMTDDEVLAALAASLTR
jgi:hypothetical protein